MSDVFPNRLAGDADALEADGRLYASTADAIQQAIDGLRAITTDAFESDAVRALQHRQGRVAADIQRAWGRYRAVGDAITIYARELRAAQQEADQALHTYFHAEEQAHALNQFVQSGGAGMYPGHPFGGGLGGLGGSGVLGGLGGIGGAGVIGGYGAGGTTSAQDIGAMVERAQEEHRQVLVLQQQAVERWQQAAQRKAVAAHNAAMAVNAGNKLNDLNDDFWDDLGDIADVLGIVAGFAKAVLRVVATFLSILAAAAKLIAVFVPAAGGVSAALFFGAQMVNLAIAGLTVLQDVLKGANVFDAVLATMAVVASTAAAMAASAVTAGVTARVAESLGPALGAQAGEAVADAAGSLNSRVTEGVLGLGGDDVGSVYEDASAEVRPGSNGGIGGGLASAFGVGDRVAGGWVRDFHIGENPGGILPGGTVAGGTAGLTGAAAAASTGMGMFGETGSTGPLDSMARDAWKVAFPLTDGAALAQIQSVAAPLDFRAGAGDLAQGAVHDFIGGTAIGHYAFGDAQGWWESAARHAVGADTAGVTASNGLWSSASDAVRDTLGVAPGGDPMHNPLDFYGDRLDRVVDGVDHAGAGLTLNDWAERQARYLGYEHYTPDTPGKDAFGWEWNQNHVVSDVVGTGVHIAPGDGSPARELPLDFFEPVKVYFR